MLIGNKTYNVIYLRRFRFFADLAAADGYCSFSPYLWTYPGPISRDSPLQRNWTSGTQYLGNTNSWNNQKEIVVREKEIVFTQRSHAFCDNGYGKKTKPCYHQTITYSVICIQEEKDSKFRVHLTNHKGFV